MRYIDLHLHLDGAITPDIATRLAELQGIKLPKGEALRQLLTVMPGCRDLTQFLTRFETPISLLQTPAALSEAVYLLGEQLLSEGVIYAELRFAPQSHCRRGMTQRDAIIAALDGLSRTRLHANLILCMMRGTDTLAANRETVGLAAEYLVEDGGVTALDLAGAEALFPTADYRELFEEAHALGIPFTIHAGEAAGPDSVRTALSFGPRRIGHGVHLTEDESVLAELIERGIYLELCPTSNVQTCAVASIAEHPLLRWLDAGVPVTLNSDDPGIEGISISREYRSLREQAGMTDAQQRRLLENAVEAAFTTGAVKDELHRQLFD